MKNSTSQMTAAFAACLLAIVAQAGPTNLIKNGGFEGPVLSGLGVLSTVAAPADWTVTEGYGEQIRNVSTGSYLPSASEGSQYYYLGDYGQHANLQQSVALQAGHSYLLNFDLSPLLRTPELDTFFAYSPAVVDLTISSLGQTLLPGLTYDYYVPAQAQRWMTETYAFTALFDAAYLFSFTTLGANGGYTDAAFIDNVVLTDTTHRVPDASGTMGLLAIPLLGLVWLNRRNGGSIKFA